MARRTLAVAGAIVVFVVGLALEPADAQLRQAELTGTVTDESGGVLPGATVTATHVSTQQSRVAVSDGQGRYLLTALPVGVYEIRIDLSGFAPLVVTDYRLGIGDTARLDARLPLSTLEEVITISGEVPLVDPASSALAGRIDTVQMEELPLGGRDWLNLATLAPGVKSDGAGARGSGTDGGQPTAGVGGGEMSKVYLDGGQVQNLSTTRIDLEVSKEIIGEFEVIANRFDAQMGRAGTVLVNAVTRSGTDHFMGSAFLYFRDDALNSRDFFTGNTEPYRNAQYGGTFGGPILRGRTHFFGGYERQTEPKTVSSNTGIASLDAPMSSDDTRNLYFIRADHSLTQDHRLSFRFNRFDQYQPNQEVGGLNTVSNSRTVDFTTNRYNVGLNSVFGSRFVNQLQVTYLRSERFFNRFSGPPDAETLGLAPPSDNQHVFPSAVMGGRPNVGNELPWFWYVRNDSTYVAQWRGRHTLKFGAEWNHQYISGVFANNSNGTFFYEQNPPNLATCCAGGDQSAWDKSQFPVPVRYSQNLGNFFYDAPNDIFGFYVQDDWTISPRFTLNVGLRYDYESGSLDPSTTGTILQPRKNDANNWQPRVGFAWDLTGTGRTVMRGGAGVYYDQVRLNLTFNQRLSATRRQVSVTTFNTAGDPAFALDPLSGRDFNAFLDGAGAVNVTRFADNAQQPHVYTGSLGIAHQLTSDLAVSVDYVAQGSDAMFQSRDTNLFCCLPDGNAIPINSGNYPELGGFVQGAGRPDPRFNAINTYHFDGKARYHGLQFAVNKRMTNHYQFGVTYLLSKNDETSGLNNVFDLEDSYGRSTKDQRHRLVANVVSRLPGGLHVAGIVHAASGFARAFTTGGIDINGDGSPAGDRPTCGLDPRFNAGCAALGVTAGQRIPISPWRTDPVFRVDLRFSRPLALGRTRIDPSVEAYNLFNRENYDPQQYNTSLTSAQFQRPGRSSVLAYQPRQVQLAVRVTF